MSGLVEYLEEALIAFVKERLPHHEWREIVSRECVEGKLEDDDVNELKEYCFYELMNDVNWDTILDGIKRLADMESEGELDDEGSVCSASTS